eukprot:sb/3479114/
MAPMFGPRRIFVPPAGEVPPPLHNMTPVPAGSPPGATPAVAAPGPDDELLLESLLINVEGIVHKASAQSELTLRHQKESGFNGQSSNIEKQNIPE